MNKPLTSNRIYYMDSMRSVLMILGVVLHSANVFSSSDWAITNTETSIFFHYLVEAIHLFRMPAFFIVSGFFCHMTLKKYNSRLFIKIRIPRIIIPLIVTAFTLNLFQNYLLHHYADVTIYMTDKEFWLHGAWLSHLWFLNCLLYYFIISALLYSYIPNTLNFINKITNNILTKSKGLYLFILPLITIILLKLSYIIPTIGNSGYDFSISDSIKYSGYFIFGIILGTNRELLDKFIKPSNPLLLITLTFLTSLISIYLNTDIHNKFISEYLTHIITWLSCMACFYLFFRFFNENSVLFKYLASASYSIYLFHHVFVIFIGIFIIQLQINIFIKFLILMSSVFIVTNIIHYYLINRYSIICYLFNGRHHNE